MKVSQLSKCREHYKYILLFTWTEYENYHLGSLQLTGALPPIMNSG